MGNSWRMLLLFAVTGAANAADRFDAIRDYIRIGLTEHDVPSMSVAVVQEGRVVWEEGFGWADRERRVAATAHTVYSLASISKPITATAVMTLVQSGKVDLDKPVNDYLGAAKLQARVGDVDAATVRRVANHTSGLPEHANYFFADEPYQPPSRDLTILRYGNLVTAPGETYQYSNLGYGVLDYVVQRVSGQSFAQYLRTAVFLPLGMTRSSLAVEPRLASFIATRYDDAGRALPAYTFDHSGASAVFASAHDLARFGMFHLKAHLPDQQAILSDASIDEMHRQTTGTADKGYGVGFVVEQRHGYRVVSHSGSMSGVATDLRIFPAQSLAIVVLSNSNSPQNSRWVANTAERIAAVMLPKWQIAGAKVWPPVPPFVTPEKLLGTWRGKLSTYVAAVPVKLRFLANGEVHAQVGDQAPTLIDRVQIKDGVLLGRLTASVGTPDTARADGGVVYLSLRLRGDVLNGSAMAFAANNGRTYFGLTHWMELVRQ
ncbi:serine hydrolase domain-containing protein [Steroidobacter sp.]|uniref:serine hydrolase domain-containing protein n=1 Tax=Steroidobacter sp. TaxID=1978227 RepID=UPI001A385D27|nr:serine hydrolase domain-containing protein [Steroidobacter sp.]MBL8271865.1 beta-lactamase family protein [Steroidobacter sp.]